MCGRYMIQGSDDLSERFKLTGSQLRWLGTYNAAPSEQLPIVVEAEDGERQLRLMQWGLVPRWTKPGGRSVAPINARAETVRDKPMFRRLIGSRRCLVPANGFYEWQQQGGPKQPYFIGVNDEPLFAFGGLYDEGAGEEDPGSYTILTTQANELVAPIHNRMPVILRPEDEGDWLSREVTDADFIERLFAPFAADDMFAYPVSKAVNNVRNDGPELIEPLDE